MMAKQAVVTIGTLLAVLAGSANAEEADGSGWLQGLDLDLNAGNASQDNSSGLALEYTYAREFGGNYRQWGGDVAQLWKPRAQLEANGSAALVDENPQDFSDLKLDLGAEVQSLFGETDIYEISGFYAKEGNEKFDSSQSVYGATLALADVGVLTSDLTDDLVVKLSYGSVDPSGDENRKLLLGDALTDFDRVHLRAEYSFRLGTDSTVRKVEITYNEYRELDAPAIIRTAELDDYTYSTIAFYLPNNLALTYGKGKLPFDQEDGTLVQLGYQLQSW